MNGAKPQKPERPIPPARILFNKTSSRGIPSRQLEGRSMSASTLNADPPQVIKMKEYKQCCWQWLRDGGTGICATCEVIE